MYLFFLSFVLFSSFLQQVADLPLLIIEILSHVAGNSCRSATTLVINLCALQAAAEYIE